jgi:hypothetical protein
MKTAYEHLLDIFDLIKKMLGTTIKIESKVIPVHPMKVYKYTEIRGIAPLTSARDGVEWSNSHPVCFNSEKEPWYSLKKKETLFPSQGFELRIV